MTRDKHFEILAEALAEIKAVVDRDKHGALDEVREIVKGCLEEIAALPEKQEPKYKDVWDWLHEMEGYSARIERLPTLALSWVIEAWKLGAVSVSEPPKEEK